MPDTKIQKLHAEITRARQHNNEDAKRFIASKQLEIEQTPAESAVDCFIKASVCFSKDRFEEARNHLLLALKLNPDYLEAYHLLTSVHIKLRQFEHAKQALEEIIKRCPEDKMSINDLANILDEIGNSHEAITYYARVIELDKSFISAYNNKAAAHKHCGEYDEAINTLLAAIKIDKTRPTKTKELYYNLAKVYEAKGMYPNALQAYNDALAAEDNYVSALNDRGLLRIIMGDYPEAVCDFEEAIKHSPEHKRAVIQENLVRAKRDANLDDSIIEHKRRSRLLKKLDVTSTKIIPPRVHLALVITATVKSTPTVSEWKLADTSKHKKSAYYGKAYKNSQGQIIIVHVIDKKKIDALLKMAPEQILEELKALFALATNFVDTVKQQEPNCECHHSGHGFAAALAECCAIKYADAAVTFDSVGAKELAQLLLLRCIRENIITFFSEKNDLNTLFQHYGELCALDIYKGASSESPLKKLFESFPLVNSLSKSPQRLPTLNHLLTAFDPSHGWPKEIRNIQGWSKEVRPVISPRARSHLPIKRFSHRAQTFIKQFLAHQISNVYGIHADILAGLELKDDNLHYTCHLEPEELLEYIEDKIASASTPLPSSVLTSNPASPEVITDPTPILDRLTACQNVSEIVTRLRKTSDPAECKAYESFLLKILDKARQTIVLREDETLKSIFPLIELYPDKVLSILIDELKRSALRTNPYLYIGLSSVLQMALADETIRNKIGQASFLSLLNYVVSLFNDKVVITPGDQTIPYLTLDVLNLCIMNMKVLGINPLPPIVKEGIEGVLKVLEPHNKGVSDVIKMQRLYAENMMQSIDADISTWNKILPFLGPLAKLGLGIGLIGVGTGIIAGTEGAAASQGAKLIWSGLQSSASGGWELYKAIQAAYPNFLNWYAKTLAIYIKCSVMEALKENKEIEKDFITFLQFLRQGDNLGQCNIGLLGIIYRLTQLYPSVSQEVKKEIILTLSAIGYKPGKKPAPELRKNAMVALKYLYERSGSESAKEEYDKCVKKVRDKSNLEHAIKQQEPFFKQLNNFVQEKSAQLEKAQPTLLKEVQEKIKLHNLQQSAHESQRTRDNSCPDNYVMPYTYPSALDIASPSTIFSDENLSALADQQSPTTLTSSAPTTDPILPTLNLALPRLSTSTLALPSLVNPQLKVSHDNWVVSLLHKPQGSNPEHAFIILEGMRENGTAVFFRFELTYSDNPRNVATIKLSPSGKGDDRFCVSSSKREQFFSEVMVKHDAVRGRSWNLSRAQAKQLHLTVCAHIQHPPHYQYLGNKSLAAKASSQEGHNCFTWAREVLLDLNNPNIVVEAKLTDFVGAKTTLYLNKNSPKGSDRRESSP